MKLMYITEHRMAAKIKAKIQELEPLQPDYGYIFYNPETKRAHIVSGDSDEQDVLDTWIAALEAMPGMKKVTAGAEGWDEEMGSPGKPTYPWILIRPR